MKKTIFIIAAIVTAFLALFFLFPQKAAEYNLPQIEQVKRPENQTVENQAAKNDTIKQSVLISVPFTAQAPFGSWTPPYNEACEEANSVMAIRWASGLSLTLQEANSEIISLALFENKLFGFNEDTNVEQTARLLSNYYGYHNFEIRNNVLSIDDIKKELNAGNVVLIPVAGRLLNNPHFTPPGPPYHMVLIRGYDESKRIFFTNDPGTKYGENYPYSYFTIDTAWHDWTGSASTILQGGRNMLVVRPAK